MTTAMTSGKGGAGKTTASGALALIWTGPAISVDLDVKEPDLPLFPGPGIEEEEKAFIEVPVADETRCNHRPAIRRAMPIKSNHKRKGGNKSCR